MLLLIVVVWCDLQATTKRVNVGAELKRSATGLGGHSSPLVQKTVAFEQQTRRERTGTVSLRKEVPCTVHGHLTCFGGAHFTAALLLLFFQSTDQRTDQNVVRYRL